ncbi:copper homeostasis protein CutC [Neorhizobium alkalisoli]|uniref:PF03932 family protein CutC n=1 Tax=Neorhizobium alkalisoli TaxID=528178 RepID=A0A561QVQ9_9HYPH|nr:copper homeostasis protein CutC [Neorhizobium alkalisoli]TWF54435.1 copper homeostasis protein [Neorhizobium alkalisoli]
MSVLLEVCVDSPQGLEAAIAGGADRIELCAALDVGGLTPSSGLMALAAKVPVPVYAMIRPRAGDFVFDEADEAAMLADIDAVRSFGLAGVVIGANLPDMRLDICLLERLVSHSAGLGLTLHRAFDLVQDPFEAVDQAADLGVERILTSGLGPRAPERLDLLAALKARAQGKISIMPGSGINAENAAELVRRTGVSEIHSSCRKPVEARDRRSVEFGFEMPTSYKTSREAVAGLRSVLSGF